MILDFKIIVFFTTFFFFFFLVTVLSRSIVVKLTFFSLTYLLLSLLFVLFGFSFIALLILLIHITGLISLYLWCFKMVNWRTSFLEQNLLDSFMGIFFIYSLVFICTKFSLSFFFDFLHLPPSLGSFNFFNHSTSNIQNLGSCMYGFYSFYTTLIAIILVIVMTGLLYLY